MSKKIEHWLDFFITLTQKELSVRYKHTVAGFLWLFVNPLLQMVVIGLVFRNLIPHSGENYFLFLFAGLLPWNYFSMTISKATPAFFFERNLIQKAKFPKELIILSIVFSNYINFLISMMIFLLIAIVFFHTPIIGIIFLIPITVWLLMLVVGFSLLTSSLNVRFRDTNFFVQAILPLWFYSTPIIYEFKLVPQQLQQILKYNPVFWIIDSYHRIFIQHTFPLSLSHIESICVGALFVGLGYIVYRKTENRFDDWL